MSPSRARYVTACQQLLALGVVVMALVPATRVVSLDVVGVGPGQGVAQPSISVSPDQQRWAARPACPGSRAVGSAAPVSPRVPSVGSRRHRQPACALRRHPPGRRSPEQVDQPKRWVTRSASAIASSRAGSAPVTRTSEPLDTSGRVRAATPGGEAGFAVDRSRSPPVES